MAKSYAKFFYKSKAWRKTRESYLSSINYLCQRCLEQGRHTPVSDVHHIIHLNESNINDPDIALNHENLIGLCKECHNTVHGNGSAVRDDLEFDEQGNLIER